MSISLINDKVEGPLLARILLMQAGVKPSSCDCEELEECFCQYVIDAIDIDVFHIRIIDRGKEVVLKAIVDGELT